MEGTDTRPALDPKGSTLNGAMEIDEIVTVPRKFADATREQVEMLVCHVLQKVVSHNDAKITSLEDQQLTRFHAKTRPAITVIAYIDRIVKYATIDKNVLLSFLVFADRICLRDPSYTVSTYTVHRFLITAAACGSKILSDKYLTNSLYAKVGGIPPRELNLLELEFLLLLDWHVVVPDELLQAYYELAVSTDAGVKFE